MAGTPSPQSELEAALAAAVAAVGGQDRDGQLRMAQAVAGAIDGGEHLLVQAGTGTGKSLAYLVPAVLHSVGSDRPVVVATATIALQRQLVERDLPTVSDALAPLLPRRPEFAILKGRQHYLCLNRLEGAPSDDPDDAVLFEAKPSGALGRDVVRIRKWAETTETGDRDELVPLPRDRAWRALSVTAQECVGAARCRSGDRCFTELARDRARHADVVVTNHAMLAIDAFAGIPLLPEHDVVIVDEAHELVDRATGAVTDELTAAAVERAARRVRRWVDSETDAALELAAQALDEGLSGLPGGRLTRLEGLLFDALVAVRDVGHLALQQSAGRDRSGKDGGDDAARSLARGVVEELYDIAGRIVSAGPDDVLWVTPKGERRPAVLRRAPLSVAGLLRDRLFSGATAVLTSATLELGGSFEPVAAGLGLVGEGAPPWSGLDVGSPFDYPRQAILYIARHLPPPGRDGLADAVLDELAGLVEAAGGRTLGLFSSQRAAEQAAAAMRDRLDLPVLCQGEDSTAELVRRFAADPGTCLFGTLSLWQGVDVPGASCHLVVIDRIPFPRPDDPLVRARQEAAGPAGFMTVSAASAALLLAQGSGRLIRSSTDRGVVAVLDPRLSTARYASFLRRSMPPFWTTEDPEQARRSLAALRDLHDGVEVP